MSFYKELKRRNVFRVGIAYIIIAWLLLQVGDTLGPALLLPDWINSALAFFLILGFPLAMFFSWAFELTPDGLRREHEVDPSRSIKHQTRRKLDFLVIGTLVVALGYFAYDKLVLSAAREAALIEATMLAVTEQVAIGQEESAETNKSIAVLPFVNMSSDEEQEYFSDGLSEELLHLLTKIPELRVTSRSSAFAFKGEKIDIPLVAKKLNVAHILEGSVRKAGNQVRITAQLIEAQSDTHLWSETYDRTLDNIFAIQDEIAAAVVAQLKITLLGAAPTIEETDPEAYALYLQGRHLIRQKTARGFEQALAVLQQALLIDPGYAAAWDLLGTVYSSQTNLGLLPIDEGYTLAREATSKALASDVEYAPAHASLGYIAMAHDLDLSAAARYLERALQLEPGNTDIILIAASLSVFLGRLDEAFALNEFVVARDPVNPASHAFLGLKYSYAERWDQAIASFSTALTLSPDYSAAQYYIGKVLLHKGEPQLALEAMQLEESVWRMIGLPLVYHALGQREQSDAALVALIEQYGQDVPYNIAYVLAYRGEGDRAFEWLDRAVEHKDGGLSIIPSELLFSNIHDDPRWPPFLESIGKLPEQLAAVEFKVTLPE